MFGAESNLLLNLETECVVFSLDDVFDKIKEREGLDQSSSPIFLG